MTSDLAVITCLFNPSSYATKYANYERFARGLARVGAHLLTVECLFPGQESGLGDHPELLRLQAADVMWQKERLLNIALAHLPARFTKVAWLDGDILFERRNWLRDTSRLLDRYVVVQPFSSVVRLPRGHLRYRGEGESWASFASVLLEYPNRLLEGKFDVHGHTGFGWAARRDFLVACGGLYDHCIAGSGDHLMAHAFAGDWDSPCISRLVGSGTAYQQHFYRWARQAFSFVESRIGCTRGRILHLWHGDRQKRRYVERNSQLVLAAYDPEQHIRRQANDCWQWTPQGVHLRDWMVDYFESRQEDG
jgi:hypothetical protein